MIKIEHTEKHPTDKATIGGIVGWVQVTEAKLVLVDAGTRAIPHQLSIYDGKYFVPETDGWAMGRTLIKPILISETEKIDVGDWVLDTITTPFIRKATKDFINDINNDAFKILALPEHFSSQQLQMIVDGKLKDGDKVLVECEKTHEVGERTVLGQPIIEINQIKLNPHITIYPVEEKKYTIKEIIDELKYGLSKYGCKNEISGKWVLEDNIYYILNGLNKT